LYEYRFPDRARAGGDILNVALIRTGRFITAFNEANPIHDTLLNDAATVTLATLTGHILSAFSRRFDDFIAILNTIF